MGLPPGGDGRGLEENGCASHAEWVRARRQARSGTLFCLGSQDESGGNQACTRLPDGTLRLRVPMRHGPSGAQRRFDDLLPAGEPDTWNRRGGAVLPQYRFVCRDGVRCVQVATERPAAK